MNQMAIDFDPPRARRRDPETSQEAASRVRDFASGHYAKIMHALRTGKIGLARSPARAGVAVMTPSVWLPPMIQRPRAIAPISA